MNEMKRQADNTAQVKVVVVLLERSEFTSLK